MPFFTITAPDWFIKALSFTLLSFRNPTVFNKSTESLILTCKFVLGYCKSALALRKSRTVLAMVCYANSYLTKWWFQPVSECVRPGATAELYVSYCDHAGSTGRSLGARTFHTCHHSFRWPPMSLSSSLGARCSEIRLACQWEKQKKNLLLDASWTGG